MPVVLSTNSKFPRGPHWVKPSAFPHALLTVSGICLFNVIIIGAAVDLVLTVVIDARGFAAKIRVGFNCVCRQSQLERMLRPAISKD